MQREIGLLTIAIAPALLCEDAGVRAVLLLAAGCFSPDPQAGAPCGSGRCPSGLVCSAASNTCERTDVDAPPPVSRDAATMRPLVQYKGAQQLGVDALTVTLDAAPAPGHLLVLIGGDPKAPLTGVTGGGVRTWTRAVRSIENSNIEIYYGITDGSSATVAMALAGSDNVKTAVVTEWADVTIFERATANDGTVTPATTPTILTTMPNTLAIFAASSFQPNNFGMPGPNLWTEITFPTPTLSQGQWYRVIPTATGVKPEVSVSGSLWDAALVTFR